MIELIVIIILILLIINLIKKKENFITSDQALLNVASVYADTSGTVTLNNLRFTNKICDSNNNCIINNPTSIDISNNLTVDNIKSKNIDASGINTSIINSSKYCNDQNNCITVDNTGILGLLVQ